MMVKLDQPISSFSSNLGDAVSATLENDVFANDVVTAQTAEIGIMRRLLTQLPAK
jgi:uncharacterized protein (DUF305 family)